MSGRRRREILSRPGRVIEFQPPSPAPAGLRRRGRRGCGLSAASALAGLLLLAPACRAAVSTAPVPAAAPSGTVESSKLKLDAQDADGALADAEAAVAAGAGADAYAARADAKRALGRPLDEAVADYAEASARDPRYLETYKGLLVRRDSVLRPASGPKAGGAGASDAANVAADVLALALGGGMILVVAMSLFSGREKSG